jgi:hypothetical protein
MRAQLRLLEYLVHMWDVNEKAFNFSVHTLTLDIDEIYFLTSLSHRGSQVSLFGSISGGEPMDYYVAHNCEPGIEKHSGKIAIKDVRDFTLRNIFYTITQIVRSVVPHMDLQIHFKYVIECMEPLVFNWCRGLLKNMKKQLTKCRPLTNFWRTLVMFDHFWDFDRLVEGRAQGEVKIAGSLHLFRDFWV